jgi:hypothetical protein
MEKEKFINTKLSKYVKFWKHDIKPNATYASKQAQDGPICEILGVHSITFVKIVTSSKFHSFGRLLAIKQWEVRLWLKLCNQSSWKLLM